MSVVVLPDWTMETHMLRLSVLPGSTVVECNPELARTALEVLRPELRDQLHDLLAELAEDGAA